MPDNTKQSADENIATDDVGGVKHQRVKVEYGEDGSATDVSAENPLPVTSAALGGTTDAEVTGNGSIIGLLKRLRTLLAGGLPAALTGSGNLKVAVQETSLSSPLPVRLSDGSEGIGVTAKRLHVDDGGSSLSVDDNGGSLTVDAGGTVAHDAEDSGNPIKIGGKVVTALIAALATGDRTNAYFDKFGRALGVVAPLDQVVSGSIDLTDTTTTDVIAKQGEKVAIVVTDIEVSNGDATVGTFVEIFDDSTKKWKGFAGTLGGGFSQHNEKGLFVCSADKPVRAKCLTTSSETSVNISGYKIPA